MEVESLRDEPIRRCLHRLRDCPSAKRGGVVDKNPLGVHASESVRWTSPTQQRPTPRHRLAVP